jgi:hypothetical protein
VDVLKRIEWLKQQIASQKKIKNQFIREGNELGVRRTDKKIAEHEKELYNLI